MFFVQVLCCVVSRGVVWYERKKDICVPYSLSYTVLAVLCWYSKCRIVIVLCSFLYVGIWCLLFSVLHFDLYCVLWCVVLFELRLVSMPSVVISTQPMFVEHIADCRTVQPVFLSNYAQP